jgi:hypothetical protein
VSIVGIAHALAVAHAAPATRTRVRLARAMVLWIGACAVVPFTILAGARWVGAPAVTLVSAVAAFVPFAVWIAVARPSPARVQRCVLCGIVVSCGVFWALALLLPPA